MRSEELVEVRPSWLFIATLAGLGMIGPFATDAIFPAFANMGADFGVSEAALQQLVSVYLLAYAAMSLLHGPLSDALGRRPVMGVGMALFVASSVWAAFAPNFAILLVCRALQGMAAGAGQIVSRAQVRDVFIGRRAQRAMAQVSMVFVIGPVLAPVIGGWIVAGGGSWSGVFLFQAAYGLVLMVLIIFWMPETHALERRTPLDAKGLAAGLGAVARSADGRRLASVAALAFGGQFLLISSAPLFINRLLHRGATDFWLLFVPLMVGALAGSWVSGHTAGAIRGPRVVTAGYITAAGAGALLTLLALFPETSGVPWILLPIPLFTFGISVAFPILTIAMLDLFPGARGAAASFQSLVSILVNAVISGLLAPLLARSMLPLMLGAWAFLLAAGALWWWHLRSPRHPATEPDVTAGQDGAPPLTRS